MTDKILRQIDKKYHLVEKSVGEFREFRANGMKFTCSAYRAEGLGHVSVMRAVGFFGLMKMDTLVIAPDEIDAPLLSYDRIYAMGNDTLIIELYDTLDSTVDLSAIDELKRSYAKLPERFAEGEEPAHWYDSIRLPQTTSKKGKKKDTPEFDRYTTDYVEAYLDISAESCDRGTKILRTDAYVNGLVTQGGPATDVFKKQFGEEKTRRILGEVLFGTM